MVLDLDEKNVIIACLILIVIVLGAGLYSYRAGFFHKEVDYNGLFNVSDFFHDYKAYLDKEINFSEIQSGSMRPTFSEGDIIFWVETDADELKVGDIIIYEHGGKKIAHRINDVKHNDNEILFETKGDYYSSPDDYLVSEDDLEGKVIGVIYQ